MVTLNEQFLITINQNNYNLKLITYSLLLSDFIPD